MNQQKGAFHDCTTEQKPADAGEQTQLVQGSIGETVKLKRSDDWKRMTATAVFSNGELTRDVIVSGDTLLIPWELLQEDGRRLTLNFHGADDSGCVVQTNIASQIGRASCRERV